MLSRRTFLKGLAAAGPAILLHGERARAANAKRPNLIFVFADQLRACSVGCLGEEQVRTPSMDKLASQGVLFTNAYSANPVCTPYRATLHTGRYCHANGIMQNDVQLPLDSVTLPKVLRSAGYKTAFVGKWHLHGGPRMPGFVPPGPARQGYDFWAANICQHDYFRTVYFRDTPEPIRMQGYEPDGFTDEAIGFIKANKDGPFFLCLAWGPPHDPYVAPPEYMRQYRQEEIRLRPNVPKELNGAAANDANRIAAYYAATTNVDWNLGRLMAALDGLGIAEDTVLVFSSDHGDMLGSQGEAKKCRPWEESANVPLILRYPRRGRSGAKSDVLVNSVDVMPTLLSLAGVPIPESVQGRDLSFAALGKQGAEPPSLYLAFYCTWQGMKPWRAVVTKDWKYARHEAGPWLLYDRKSDPFELKNLASEPGLATRREGLDRELAAWMAKTGDDWRKFTFPDLHPSRNPRPWGQKMKE
jgi:arylsulfatase A-like enzyme